MAKGLICSISIVWLIRFFSPLPYSCVIIFAYGTLKCLLGKTFRTILRIFYRYRPRFHTETRRAQ
ncbi:MAG: hypothetical protein EWV56_16255 [Microcystis aeruginosa Ma_QC_C_20070823_S13D]|nr:MAG: hypothetical protein EWV56_16255 [Microcystis aeruginosa Ma_QC_C_20070823_S13D]